jgi:SAM-dependent methyltransferase
MDHPPGYFGVVSFVRAALPATPARVLEVGAGSGELAAALTQAGYELVAIDPASESAGVQAIPLHELDEPIASFDAAVAVVSLHHVDPLEESCRHLAESVRPDGCLIIDEFDVERFDERAAQWLIDARGPTLAEEHRDPAALVAELRDHLHSLARIRGALDQWFALGEPVRGPYLYRWDLAPGHREPEEELIAAGRLPATGARLVGRRREGWTERSSGRA